jgi:hypothetical protein
MDCYRDTCMTTEKCRCYALIGKGDSKSNQVCAHKRGDRYFLCEASCCKGGCPGQCSGVLAKTPYGVIDKITSLEVDNRRILMWVGIIVAVLVFMSTVALF